MKQNQQTQQLKKHIALWMACVMLFSMFSPFTLKANPSNLLVLPDGIGVGVAGTAFGGDLRASFNAALTPAPGRPELIGGADVSPEGNVLLNWSVSVDPLAGTGAFMDVLRYFDDGGRKHELTLAQLNAEDGVGLVVNYDIYFPRLNDSGEVVGYVHISDPLRGSGRFVGDYRIWMTGVNTYERAFDYIITNNRNSPVVDSVHNTMLNRVNDRMRFIDTTGLPDTRPFTPVRSDYMNYASNFNSGIAMLVTNPNYDPDDPESDEPPMIDGFAAGPFPETHYNALSPSFNISEGHGYSFRFGGRAMHFRWENGQFLYYIEDILKSGNVYDFVLERYTTSANVNAYVTGTSAPRPNFLTTENSIARTERGTVYMLTGVNRDTINAIPFAANSGITEDIPNTRAARLTDFDSPNALINAPEYDTTRLDMRDNPPNSIPAEQDLGLDIRFNLPAFYDEVRGDFVYQITDPNNSHAISQQLGVALLVDVGMGETPEDFAVSFPLRGMPLYPANWNADFSVRPTAVNREQDMTLNNVSLLHRTGQDFADRVRIMVGGLSPSIAYEWVRLSVTPIETMGENGRPVPMPTNFLVGGGRVGYPEDPFYTFLNFRFDTLLGRPVIIAEPFNRRVAHLPGFGVRTGYYQLVSDFPTPGGWAPTMVNETTTEVFFNLPDFVEEYRGFYITKSIHPPHTNPTPDIMFSQDVWWAPNRVPTVDIPDRFSVSNVLHRPMRGDEHAGHLSYTLQWNIASHSHIMALLGYPTDEFGSPDNVLRATYVTGHSTSPETEALLPTVDRIHREYIRVELEIRRNDDLPSRLEVRYAPTATTDDRADTSDFVPSPPHITPPVPPRFLGNNLLPPTVHPIVNRFYNEGWVPLNYRPDPSIGENMLFAEIDIITNSVRNFRYPPPPQNLRRDFHFPGIYFMNVRLDSWRIVGEAEPRGGESPWTLFDYVVVDDFGKLDPPTPLDITVEARPRIDETPVQPYLDVSYNIPAGAVWAYLNTFYPMETQLTTNLYIGAFEETIMENYFPLTEGANPSRVPVAPEEREKLASASISFDDERLSHSFRENRTELDISDFQNLLRGAEGGTGVLRIEGVPLIHNVPVTTPSAFEAGSIINFATGDISQEESFAETARILDNGTNFGMHLRLTGIDENTKFFLFSDLEIEKWIDEDGVYSLRNEPNQANPAVSGLTGIVSDTTIGTPQKPGPGEISPSAPQNIGVRDIEQRGATIFWDPLVLTPAELEDEDRNIRIEWEIIRLQDGRRLTDVQMNERDPDFAEIFRKMEIAPRRKGWATENDIFSTVMTVSGPAVSMNIRRNVDPKNTEDYEYNRREVDMRDNTLHPNSLYFYYVRTVRIEEQFNDQLNDTVLIRSVSSWVEVPVTTVPIEEPKYLRQEDPYDRAGFDGQTMALVSWNHPQMDFILQQMGRGFAFEFQIREGENAWGDVFVVPYHLMVASQLDPHDRRRIHYLVTGLEHSNAYQMRVRLHDMTANDRSVWSNVITVLTENDDEWERLKRETDAWMDYFRRKLEELNRNPFWTAQRTPTNAIYVLRPAEVFDGLMASHPDTNIPLKNTGESNIIYYLPLSTIVKANENSRGFSTTYDDLQFLLAPLALNPSHNQAIIDTLKAIDTRGSQLTDSFVRIEINRVPVESIFNVPAITPRTNVSMSLVATNNSIRNINTWDATMSQRAEKIIYDWYLDPIVREGVVEQLEAELSNEEISDHIYHLIARVEADLMREVRDFMTTADKGILSQERFPITSFNAPMHVVARNITENMFVSGHRRVNENWSSEQLIEYHNGRAFLVRAPGEFAFAGREVIIPGIETTPRGPAVTSIVARHGLEDLFGVNVDLQANATRQMVVGAIARAAGAPQGSDAFAWTNANLNVTMSSRNATGLVSNQEAIAMVMALYESRTNTRLSTIRPSNLTLTSNMTLDTRYAQAVRAAFEVGIVTDSSLNPSGSVKIGDFMNMLTLLNEKARV